MDLWMRMIAFAALSIAAFTAHADDSPLRSASPERAAPLANSDSADRSCSCRYRGGYALLGETVCIHVSGDSYLARCDMVLNNTAWKRVQDGCDGPEAVSSVDSDLSQRLAQLLEPPVDTVFVHAEIADAID